MQLQEYSRLKDLMALFSDDLIWVPFTDKDGSLNEFKQQVALVEKSITSRETNKGPLLEKLVGLILKRFDAGTFQSDLKVNDNQIDHEFKFIDDFYNHFTAKIGGTLVCECKNENSPVNVGYVSKLLEICENRQSKLGIFFSIKGFTGNGWIFAEGKRRKNFLRKNIAILLFTLKEIKLLENHNFFTLLKNKYQQLVDECEDCVDDVQKYPDEEFKQFRDRLCTTIDQLLKIKLISPSDHTDIMQKISQKYSD
ncbi:hypothetical protein ABE137_11010 [Brevibacillus laterosporus]|uniref:restriction endonuclease n=1 Tax=Brevibacillus laterosporus TaxID=1465 RepID=UPI003D1966DC